MDLVSGRDHESTGVDVRRSRERAVRRIYKGVMTGLAGMVTMAGLVVADLSGLGAVGLQRIAQFGGALLIWTGCIVVASATPHLMRVGGRASTLALASFAGMGLCGLVAVAEMFETYFLDSHVLQGYDRWGLLGAVAFALAGGMLMNVARRRARSDERPTGL